MPIGRPTRVNSDKSGAGLGSDGSWRYFHHTLPLNLIAFQVIPRANSVAILDRRRVDARHGQLNIRRAITIVGDWK
jgi:hypothetical protein